MYFLTDVVPWADFLCIILPVVCHSRAFYVFLYRWCAMIRLFISILFTDGV